MPGLDVAAIYVPCFELAGDFYDFLPLPSDNLGLAVCDVVGKGVRASLLTASIRASLRAHAMNIYDMSQVLRRVNRDLCADTLSSDFATLFYGVIDARNRRFTYANAGHVPPLFVRGQKVTHLNTGGGVLGVDTDLKWRQEVIPLLPGDVIVAHTDGLHEAMNFEDEPFGRKRVEQAAMAAVGQAQNAEGIAKHILWEMRRFVGLQTPHDDLTLVAIKVL
jgi:sigma-B regulation protein RsbU (phosphoserine phosphatase)